MEDSNHLNGAHALPSITEALQPHISVNNYKNPHFLSKPLNNPIIQAGKPLRENGKFRRKNVWLTWKINKAATRHSNPMYTTPSLPLNISRTTSDCRTRVFSAAKMSKDSVPALNINEIQDLTESGARSSKMYEAGAKIDSINLKGGIWRISFVWRYNVQKYMCVSISDRCFRFVFVCVRIADCRMLSL